ncbi:hypothetical protein CR513_53549, partial [Mucuna pruriens]
MPESVIPTAGPPTEHYEEWVSKNVLEKASVISLSDIDILLTKNNWVDKSVVGQFTMVRPFEDERVYHAAQENEDDYFFMHETLFLDLGISLPFDFFFADVLWELGVAPSQLHPNFWATLQAFQTVCHALAIILSAPLLFSFYTARGFKVRYVKVLPVRDAAIAMDGNPIPMYWRLPNKIKGLTRGQLPMSDRWSFNILNQPPRGVNCKAIVAASLAYDPFPLLKGIFCFGIFGPTRPGADLLIVLPVFCFADIFQKSGYDLSALMRQGGVAAKEKLVEAEADAAKSKAVLTGPSVQVKMPPNRCRLLFLLLHRLTPRGRMCLLPPW